MNAFPETLEASWKADELEHLISVTHTLGAYSLYFKHGEPFKPVSLRVHGDPISIIARVLELNGNSYTKINDFVSIGRDMVSSGFSTLGGPIESAVMADPQIRFWLA